MNTRGRIQIWRGAFGCCLALGLLQRNIAHSDPSAPDKSSLAQPVRIEGSDALLDPFYAALLHLESTPASANALVRISQFGDSLTADDHVTARARDRMQARFGDGGAGFVYLSQPTIWPQRQSGSRRHAEGFALRSMVGAASSGGHGRNSGNYGLGGAAFDSSDDTGRAMVATAREGAGSSASLIELSYLAQPHGGTLAIELDGKALDPVKTWDAETRAGFQQWTVSDGAHRLALHVRRGAVRLFGVTLERDRGVLWENLGLISASTFQYARVDLSAMRTQVEHRAAELNVMFYGANDIDFLDGGHADFHASDTALQRYRKLFDSLVATVHDARPHGACLVLGAIDLTGMRAGHRRDRATLQSMIAIQRQAARDHQCAFWDTYSWMGGSESAVRWRRAELLGRDYAHFTIEGSERLADALVDALLAGYAEYRARQEKPAVQLGAVMKTRQ